MRKLLLLLFIVKLTPWVLAQGCTPGNWSESNQPPISCRPYPNGLWNKPLPNAGAGGPMTHLLTNSDVIAQVALSDRSTTTNYGFMVVATPGNAGNNMNPLYYGQGANPIYKVVAGTGTGQCANHGTGDLHDPTGHFFHIPNQATYANLGGSDQFFTVWDQTSNEMMSAYNSHLTISQGTLPACTATTTSTACSTFTMSYCNQANYTTDVGYHAGTGAGDTLRNAPGGLIVRVNEWMGGNIPHALYLITDCETNTSVFPGDGGNALICSNKTSGDTSNTNRPPHGALFFLDYTDAQINAMNLPAWQKPLIVAMAHYGGYQGDTGGSGSSHVSRFESGEAYALAGLSWPIDAWLSGQGLTRFSLGTSFGYEPSLFVGLPDVVGPNCPAGTCGVLEHIHIADPCIPLGLMNLSGGCIGAPSAPTLAAPTVT